MCNTQVSPPGMQRHEATDCKSDCDMMPGITPAIEPKRPGGKVVIAGPCSAESRAQTLATARQLKDQCDIDMFRAHARDASKGVAARDLHGYRR